MSDPFEGAVVSETEMDPGLDGGAFEDDPDSSATVAIGIAGAILLVVIVVALQGLFGQTSRAEFRRKVEAEKPVELESLRAAQLEQIGTYRWIDAKQGVAAIPIDRAMELLVEQRRRSGTP
jgi:hypothetical protein